MMTCHSKPLSLFCFLALSLGIATTVAAQTPGAEAHLHKSRQLALEERFADAIAYADSAIIELREIGHPDSLASAYLWRAEVKRGHNDLSGAIQDYTRGSRLRDSIRSITSEGIVKALNDSIISLNNSRKLDSVSYALSIERVEAANRLGRNSILIITGGLVVVAIMLVVTYWRRASEARDRLKEKEEEVEKRRAFSDKLFGVISFELREPLDSLERLSSSLSRQYQTMSQEEGRQFILNMHQAVVRFGDTLNNVLQWAALQAGSLPLHPEVIDCATLARQALDRFKPLMAARNMEGNIFIPDGQVVRADKSMVKLVLENLISNAIQFSAARDIITCFSGNKDNLVLIGVKDTGTGMSAEEIERLFHVNDNLHDIGNFNRKGAGVGLILCKELVERNGGRLYVESTGDGTTVYFTLPKA